MRMQISQDIGKSRKLVDNIQSPIPFEIVIHDHPGGAPPPPTSPLGNPGKGLRGRVSQFRDIEPSPEVWAILPEESARVKHLQEAFHIADEEKEERRKKRKEERGKRVT